MKRLEQGNVGQQMMKVVFTLVAITLAYAAQAVEPVIQLFDGKTFKGWETVNGDRVEHGWRIEDGSIFRGSRSQSIYAAGEYGDFELSFEWKIARGGNSGIKYRVAFYPKGVWGNPAWLGCEYQLYDDEGPSLGPKHSAGALYGLYAPNEKKKLNPVGEFNKSKIVCHGAKIEHWLNGQIIVEADTSSDEWKKRIADSKFGRADHFFENRRGRIQLQDHGHDVWFRNITLRVLDEE